jgi:PAS domain S-box-containing protein
MKTPEQPPEESQRLSALRASNLLDTPPEERFDRITHLAAQLFDVPIALVSLVDKDRQWFKSCYGLGVRETGRDISFCGHAILNPQTLVVENAMDDERFADNPLVADEPGICFYAGAPLVDQSGYRLGTLCLIDRKPRRFSEEDEENLRNLADMVERELQLHELGEYYDERARALNILNEIALDTHGKETDRIERALVTATQFLNMDTAIVSSITSQAYTIRWHYERLGNSLENGMTLPLNKTYCSLLLAKNEMLAISHMGRSRYKDQTCYTELGLESYLAAPIWINKEIVGTLNFSSATPRKPGFTEIDKMFVNLLASWITDVIQQQQQTETLEKLVTHAPGMLYQYRLWPDGNSTFPYTSPGIQRIYGVTAAEAQESASQAFNAIHPDDLEGVAESIRVSADTLTFWHRQYRVRAEDDHWRWVEGQANPEKLPDGSILWHGYIVDIDERHKAEQMKNEFISTVSHELRTPLTSIAGSLELVIGGATGPLAERAEQMLSIARRNANQLRVLIDDLLDIEKLTSGKMPIHSSSQPLTETVEAALEEIQPYATPRGITIELENRAPDLDAHFDPIRMKQALANLLSNAVKFSPEGEAVRLRVKIRDKHLVVEVEDHGSGIPEEFRTRIFQKFAQADSSSARSKEGTGLGLAITRELVRAMEGDVGFESEEGKGSVFWIALPL